MKDETIEKVDAEIADWQYMKDLPESWHGFTLDRSKAIDKDSYDKDEQRRERTERFKAGVKKATHFLSSNYLLIKRNGELVVKLPLWAVLLIFIIAWHISIIALIVSLFFGVTYSFKGEADMSAANDAMGKASSAAGKVAEKVKEEYNKL